MPELYKTKEQTTIYRMAETAFLFAVYIYILTIDITKTTMHLDLPDHKYRYLKIALATTGLIRLAVMLIEDRSNFKTWIKYLLAAVAIDAVYMMIYRENHYNTALFLAILTISSIGIHYKKVLKAYIAGAATVIFSAILMSWIGATENFVFLSGLILRSSWGIKYPTDMMSLLLFLFLAVWIVCRDKSDLWFLIPGGIMVIMSYYVAYSRTGLMCSALLIVVLLLHHVLLKCEGSLFCKFIDICTCIAFPAFSAVTVGLLAAYVKGKPFAIVADYYMSSRLYQPAQVLSEYGLSLFGRDIPQNGWGGSTFGTKDYSFVDISYLLILLQFGIIALIMINIIWVLMTRKAVLLGDRRLALAMALIAFNAASEHHITQINYNILLAVPFAVLTARTSGIKETENSKKTDGIIALVLACMAAVAVVCLIPEARTIVALLNLGKNAKRRALAFVICAVALWAGLTALVALFRLLTGLIRKDQNKAPAAEIHRRRFTPYILILAVAVVGAAAAMVVGNTVIDKGYGKKADILEADQKAIDIVAEAGTSKLYITDIPSLYDEDEEDAVAAIFKGEDLARFEHTSILIDKYLDSPILFGLGFLYTEVSDEHALFTNDRNTIELMKQRGYEFYNYFPLLMTADMEDIAEKNDLTLEEDGSVVLHGNSERIKKGPNVDLRSGKYIVTYDIACTDRDINKYKACTIKITGRNGKDVLKEMDITQDMLDEDSRTEFEIRVDVIDEEDVDFRITPSGENEITVYGMTYQKTLE